MKELETKLAGILFLKKKLESCQLELEEKEAQVASLGGRLAQESTSKEVLIFLINLSFFKFQILTEFFILGARDSTSCTCGFETRL